MKPDERSSYDGLEILMRCVLCDSNSNGLSYFNIDRPLSTSFHSVHGETFCSECYEGYNEVMTDYYLEDEMNEIEGEDE